jgi:hypothetical protein
MSESALTKTIIEAFRDGTLAVLRTPEELEGLLSALPGAPSGTRTFLVTQADECNELSPVEVLAGKPYENRAKRAKEIAAGTRQLAGWEDDPNGPGFTDGVHASQWRLLNQSVEERAALVIALSHRRSVEAEDN